MINGAHVIVYSKDADKDRAFLKDVIGLPGVDVGGGWLIFGMPPSEVAVHPSDENDSHELYFMCDDVQAFIAAMTAKGVACGDVQQMGWGMLTQVALPGGGTIGVYQPRHARPKPMNVAAKRAKKRAAPKRGKKKTRDRPRRRR